MKKLSIEEKARAYDEALKVLHKYDGANIMFSQSLKEEMFPELKESKDERIRKAIIKHFKVGTEYTSFSGFSKSEIINYLEKQGEQKHVINQLKFKIGDVIKRRNSSVTYTVTKMDTSCFQLDGGHWLKLDRMSEFELVDEKTANNEN